MKQKSKSEREGAFVRQGHRPVVEEEEGSGLLLHHELDELVVCHRH